MSTRWIVSVAQVRRYERENPEYLTAVHCAVYDKDGNETIVKGYRLDHMLAQGFLEAPLEGGQPLAPLSPPVEAEKPFVGVRSRRIQPRMVQ